MVWCMGFRQSNSGPRCSPAAPPLPATSAPQTAAVHSSIMVTRNPLRQLQCVQRRRNCKSKASIRLQVHRPDGLNHHPNHRSLPLHPGTPLPKSETFSASIFRDPSTVPAFQLPTPDHPESITGRRTKSAASISKIRELLAPPRHHGHRRRPPRRCGRFTARATLRPRHLSNISRNHSSI